MPHRLASHAARALALTLTTAAAAAAQSLPGALTFSGTGGTIRDNSLNTFTIAIGATDVLPAGTGVTVRFRGLVDTGAGDLFADVVFIPADHRLPARQVRLFDFAPGGYGSPRAFDGDYSFGSSFTAPLPGGAVTPGDYASVGDLFTLFAGQSITGTVQVRVVDWWSNGGATLAAVDLAFDTQLSSVPEPATAALLAGGLLGVVALTARRRRAEG